MIPVRRHSPQITRGTGLGFLVTNQVTFDTAFCYE